MDFEQILGAIFLLSGVFLLTDAGLGYANSSNSSAIVSASNPFLAEVFIGVFLTAFGLYLLKIVPLRKRTIP